MKKLKKLMTLVAACGLTVSAWAMTPDADAAAPLPTAEAGYAITRYYFDWMQIESGNIAYDLAMAFMQGAGAALGGTVGSALGPVGTVVGAGAGAA